MAAPRRSPSSREIRKRAREFRSNPTRAEERLWSCLRSRRLKRLKFRRQHPIGKFIVDFYCAEYLLIIELDGPIHDHHGLRDAARRRWLESRGYTVLRFRNEEVEKDLGGVLDTILIKCGLG